jgi:ABC-type lipoprotein release transport system permease subunit
MWLLTLAVRNLVRNRWRTALSGSAIALSVALVVFGSNFEYGIWQDRLEMSILATSGHVVVQPEGYREDPEPDRTLEGSGQALEALRQTFPEARVLRRALVGGLLTSPRNTSRIGLIGVEPEAERPATRLDDALIEGAWLDPGDPRGVVLGAGVADALEVGVGDKVVLMTQVGDEMDSIPLRVRGLFRTGIPLSDNTTGITTIGALQRILPGEDPAHQLAVHLEREDQTPEARDRAAAAVGAQGRAVLTWQEALPELQRTMELDRGMSRLIYSFIFLIIAVVILSTMLMSVMERTREFGVLLALGLSPGRLARLVLIESLILGVLATAAGLLIQAPFTAWLMIAGLDLGELAAGTTDAAGVVLDSTVKARIDWVSLAGFSGSAIVLTVLAGVWPAWRATRLHPVDAMRHV